MIPPLPRLDLHDEDILRDQPPLSEATPGHESPPESSRIANGVPNYPMQRWLQGKNPFSLTAGWWTPVICRSQGGGTITTTQSNDGSLSSDILKGISTSSEVESPLFSHPQSSPLALTPSRRTECSQLFSRTQPRPSGPSTSSFGRGDDGCDESGIHFKEPFTPSLFLLTVGSSASDSQRNRNSSVQSSQDRQHAEALHPLQTVGSRSSILRSSGRTVWVFPSITRQEFMALLSSRGITCQPVFSCGDKSSTRRKCGQGPSTSRSRVKQGRIEKRASGSGRPVDPNHNLGGQKGNESDEDPEEDPQVPSTSDSDSPPLFACPLSKHRPPRYNNVHGPCTSRPGMPYRRVKDHLWRKHSAKSECPYCKKKWTSSDDSCSEFREHLNIVRCVSIEVLNKTPEHMSLAQEQAVREHTDSWRDNESSWKSLYKGLFPGESWIPSPYYDYLLPRWTLQGLSGTSNQLSPGDGSWVVCAAQNNDGGEYRAAGEALTVQASPTLPNINIANSTGQGVVTSNESPLPSNHSLSSPSLASPGGMLAVSVPPPAAPHLGSYFTGVNIASLSYFSPRAPIGAESSQIPRNLRGEQLAQADKILTEGTALDNVTPGLTDRDSGYFSRNSSSQSAVVPLNEVPAAQNSGGSFTTEALSQTPSQPQVDFLFAPAVPSFDPRGSRSFHPSSQQDSGEMSSFIETHPDGDDSYLYRQQGESLEEYLDSFLAENVFHG